MISPEKLACIRHILLVVLTFSAPFNGHADLPPEPPIPAFIFEYDLPPGPARPIVEYPVIDYPVRSLPSRAALTDAKQRLDPLPTAEAPSAATVQIRAPAPPSTAATAPVKKAATVDPGVTASPSAVPAAADTGTATGLDGSTDGSVSPPVEIFARPGDPFNLYLDGETWLYTGAAPNDSRVEYAGRSRSDSGIRFNFIARKIGVLTLSFSRSGSQGRAAEERRVVVEVVAPDQFLARIGAEPADSEPTVDEQGGVSFEQAWEFIESGEYEKAFALLSTTPTFDGISTAERAAAVVLSAALRTEKVSLPSPEELGLDGLGAKAEVELIDEVLKGSHRITIERQLRALMNGRKILAGFAGIDAVLFRLGELYQEPGEQRNIERAIGYFTEIIELHPLSSYWEESRRRRVYLERHFLLLR